MAQYDIFQNPEGPGYLLDVQSDLLDGLSTRLVIPMLPASQAPKPATRLNPMLSNGDESHVMMTQFMAAVPAKLLTKHVTNSAQMRDEITTAIDMLTHGFQRATDWQRYPKRQPQFDPTCAPRRIGRRRRACEKPNDLRKATIDDAQLITSRDHEYCPAND